MALKNMLDGMGRVPSFKPGGYVAAYSLDGEGGGQKPEQAKAADKEAKDKDNERKSDEAIANAKHEQWSKSMEGSGEKGKKALDAYKVDPKSAGWMEKNIKYAEDNFDKYMALKDTNPNDPLVLAYDKFLARLSGSGASAEKSLAQFITDKIQSQTNPATTGLPPGAEGGPIITAAEGGAIGEHESPKTEETEKEDDSPSHDETPAKVDADSIIDSFLEENPDLVDTPIDEWPEDAIKMLQETLNDEHIDQPDGALPGEAGDETTTEEALPEIESKGDGEISDVGKEPTTDEDNPDQDFDILELSKLVEAGDKDGAWNMLQSMFGTSTAADAESTVDTPTNALDRMVTSDQRVKKPSGGNALGKLLASLRF